MVDLLAVRKLQSRRTLAKLAGITIAGSMTGFRAAGQSPSADGKILNGWIQIENNATSLSSSGIADPTGFISWLTQSNEPVSTWIRDRLPDSLKTDLAKYSPSNEKAKDLLSTLVKEMNRIISGSSIYEKIRFSGVVLRPETAQLLRKNPAGHQLARLNKMLLEDAFPSELVQSATTGWIVKDGTIASTGAGRGVIYTKKDYGRFRWMFSIRHVSGNPDHHAGVLIFCSRPWGDDKPLDALGGIQFQVPLGGRWDYRPGKNNNGGPLFTQIVRPTYNVHEWSRVEILADAKTGTASMAVAQPLGTKAVEVLQFKDPTAGKIGPIALQMHNTGLFDEYKDISIEAEPKDHELITVR